MAVAVIVSSIVHLAARRAADAVRSSSDAAALLELARTVLAGADTPASVLDQLTAGSAARAELLENTAGKMGRGGERRDPRGPASAPAKR